MRRKIEYLPMMPVLMFLMICLLVPIVLIAISTIKPEVSNYTYVSFLKDTYNQTIILRTISISVVTTLITLLIGTPFSLWISRQRYSIRQVLTVIILFPILTNSVVRNFAWIIILGKNGVINQLLISIHLIRRPLAILYTNTSIVIGSVYLFLPIMVMTLISCIGELNFEIEEAAAIFGARPFTCFYRVILPQITPGIVTGSILVFAGTMTAYTTPQILGGNKHLMVSTLIYQQAMTIGDWNSASIISMILICLTAIILLMTKMLNRRMKNVK